MARSRISRCLLVAVSLLAIAAGPLQIFRKGTPKPEPVAETRLLMEGLNQANFRGLERLLQKPPADADAWIFARGQALLIAETGNLLMMRPPRNKGEEQWLERAGDLRESATALARAVAARDYTRSRAALISLSDTCNQCHQTFRVAARISPFSAPID